MSGLVDALVILAVVVLVIARQFRTRRTTTDRSWWVVPAVLVFLALREPGLLDPDHRTLSVLLLGAELLVGLAIGVGWAWTTRMWRTPDGTVWSRSSKAGALVWTVGIALRASLFGLGAALGLHQDSSALLLALAVTLLVSSGIMVRRAQTLPPTSGQSTAYGDGMPQPLRKERV
jgi:hypothetical protein